MFADMELIGIPHTIVVGQKSLDQGMLEYKHRRTQSKELVAKDNIIDFVISKFEN